MSASDTVDTSDGPIHDYEAAGDYVIFSEETGAWLRSPFTVDLTEAR